MRDGAVVVVLGSAILMIRKTTFQCFRMTMHFDIIFFYINIALQKVLQCKNTYPL